MKRLGLSLFLAVLCLCAPAGASEGTLQQKAPTGGCVSQDGTFGLCADGTGLDGAANAVVSLDGKNVYVTAYESDAVTVFDRDPLTGVLTQKAGTAGCLSEDGSGGACQEIDGVNFPDGIAISPDGETVYVTGQTSGAVAILDRDTTTGALSQLGCVSETGSGGECVDGVALEGADGVSVSPDGENVYVVSYAADAIAIFDRLPSGALTQKAGTAGCISETGTGGVCQDGRGLDGPYPGLLASADGDNVYVASIEGDSVAVLDRDETTGALTQKAGVAGCLSRTGSGGDCATVATLDGPNFIVEDLAGANLYVASSIGDSISVLDRAADGTLTQKAGTAGCVSETGSGGACQDGRGMLDMIGLGISPDGESVYGAALGSDAISVFDRAADGTLAQKPGLAGCVSDAGAPCVDGLALDGVRGRIAVSPDGKHVYAAASLSDAVVVFDRAPNGRPFCAPIAAGSFKHDSVVELTLGCEDPDGDPVTIAIASGPAHGTLGAIGATGKVTYTPAAGYVGPDSFTYRASDAGGAGAAVTVSMSFTNQAPVCTDGSLALQAGATKTATIACTDADGDALTLAVVDAPDHGTLGPLDPVTRTVGYTAGRTSSSDRFTISATDRTGAQAIVAIDVAIELPACCSPPPPAPTPTPTPTPTPVPTTTPPVRVPVTQVATLPSAKRCVSRRRFRIRLRRIRGNPVVRAEIRLNGKTKRRVKGRALSLPIDLRGLPRGRWTVEIITTDARGKRVVGKRRYRTCAPRRRA